MGDEPVVHHHPTDELNRVLFDFCQTVIDNGLTSR